MRSRDTWGDNASRLEQAGMLESEVRASDQAGGSPHPGTSYPYARRLDVISIKLGE
jgi:hypothetical protein